ncbi:signal peptidase I [Patescibacteria group bacterium]|jgi:signal peptidase I|nr:signal peptidase I [Patescibacteria group bacterium]
MDPVRLEHSTSSSDDDRREHTAHHGSPQHTDPPTPQNEKQENFLSEIFKFAVIALVIVIPFRMFIAQPFIVSGASMSPTFETGQYLIIDQVSYRFDDPERGDVVIFRFPEDPSKFFIKRVIGLPGETVEINGTDVVITDPETGESLRLEEPYVAAANGKNDFLTRTLDDDEYFVMGDNRSASSDSRVWGPVPERNVVGRALVRLLPVSQLELYPGDERDGSGASPDPESETDSDRSPVPSTAASPATES